MSTILDIRNATVTYQDGETTTTALADASLKAESNSPVSYTHLRAHETS